MGVLVFVVTLTGGLCCAGGSVHLPGGEKTRIDLSVFPSAETMFPLFSGLPGHHVSFVFWASVTPCFLRCLGLLDTMLPLFLGECQ